MARLANVLAAVAGVLFIPGVYAIAIPEACSFMGIPMGVGGAITAVGIALMNASLRMRGASIRALTPSMIVLIGWVIVAVRNW